MRVRQQGSERGREGGRARVRQRGSERRRVGGREGESEAVR